MKAVITFILLTFTINAHAFIRTDLLDHEVYITNEHLFFTDKFDNIYKAKTTCNIKPGNIIKVSIIGKALREDSSLRILDNRDSQKCKVLELAIGRPGWD